MRKIVVAIAVASSSVSTAQAADLPPPRPAYRTPVLPPASAIDWSGFYLGGQIGYGFGRSSGTQNANGTFFPVVPYTIDPRGFVGGAHAGYLHQINAMVIGLEVDAEAAEIKGQDTVVALGQTYFFNVKTDVLFSVRGRLGWTYNQWMAYGTGGVAFGRVETPPLSSLDGWRTGWTVGAGVEYTGILNSNWSSRLEYRYTDLGRASTTNTNPAALADLGSTDDNKFDFHTVRFGLSYHFKPPR